ncbi:DUF6093 family protein [Streptomyces sp. OR43]|uniref:DUF6093 family protein n=1 Tax=Streptomyces sp. or43 TaxID=2478957 RepID=UPI0011CEC2D6|nr:DUF6093 family protein [Streptomyces sp. or43]TXS35721.1 hypothetical protein EAO72_19065 [Streptomyces sp. or43]
MSEEAALTQGRAAAERRMRDLVMLYTQGPDTFDRDSGTTVPGTQAVLYAGKARIKPVAQSAGEDVQAGERELVLRELEVSLPWSTQLPGVRLLPGARIEVLESDDSRMRGVTLWVTGGQLSAQATAWRISAEERT